MHLSQACPATDYGKRVAERTAGADERCLCHREDRGDKTLPGIFSRIRRQFYFRDADKPLWAERQFRSGNVARPGRAVAESLRSEEKRRPRTRGLGDGHPAPGDFARGRLRVGLSLSSRKI